MFTTVKHPNYQKPVCIYELTPYHNKHHQDDHRISVTTTIKEVIVPPQREFANFSHGFQEAGHAASKNKFNSNKDVTKRTEKINAIK